MHTFTETGAGVPAFLAKLWRLVEDRETDNLICWSKDGRSFIIQNQAQFARELLPLNYKHNNMASFIRQLNMYGFHKITSIDNGGLKFDRDEMEFSHPCFKRNCPYLLEHIKRKIANTKSIDEKTSIKPEAVSKVLNDVKAMRGRQDSLDSRFSVMKQENEALWREIASLRQKHAKQQQIVNKLIQFLITIVQPTRNMASVKRHMQLMINDTPEQAKLRKASESGSECGPVIHELGEELFDEVSENYSDVDDPLSPYANMSSVGSNRPDTETPPPKVERPKSNMDAISHKFDYSNQTVDDVLSSNPKNVPEPSTSAVINTVNPDGSQIVYHVTEVPDSAPQTPETFNDENHLTTPMVKEMKRNQILKLRSRQNKRKSASSTVTTQCTSLSPATKMLKTGKEVNELRIKTEQNEIDPLLFFNYASQNVNAAEPGPSHADGSTSSTNNVLSSTDGLIISPQSDESQSVVRSNNDTDLYNTNDFIASDMPTELFENSPIIDDTNLDDANFNVKCDFKLRPSSSGRQETQIQSLTKEPDYADDATNLALKNSNLQVAKVNNVTGSDLRDEVNLHLDGVQDDLDTLKDLLRSDTYSLDANTLLGLFNDSDILGPYGLSMNQDNLQDKKSSELMTYQPIYDLSDIMDINDKTNDSESNVNTNSKQLSPSYSELNTPYHE